MRRSGLVVLAALAAMATSCAEPMAPHVKSAAAPAVAAKGATPAMVSADPVAPDPRIGAIFLGGQSLHSCTGSVVHSEKGDLIVTAAHCLAQGIDAWFAPGFTETAAHQQFWHIDAVYLDPRWVVDQDPLADFAIARVSRDGGGSVEAAVGGGFTIGSSPKVGTDVVVTGYALGVGGQPVGCTAHMAALTRGYPSVRCAGLVDGTSGSPWLSGSSVVGVTGGLEGGGCQENISYAPPFDTAVTELLTRAEAGGPGDDAPSELEDDC
jgi:hypothetical protein